METKREQGTRKELKVETAEENQKSADLKGAVKWDVTEEQERRANEGKKTRFKTDSDWKKANCVSAKYH